MSGHPGARTRAHRPVDVGQLDWMDRASCKNEDLTLFFGADGERQPEREVREAKAKRICWGCPVRQRCLEYTLTLGIKHGIFGGLDEGEREKLRRRQSRRVA